MVDKNELKVLILNNTGADIEDKVENAGKNIDHWKGAKEAAQKIEKMIHNYIKTKEKELREQEDITIEEIEKIKKPMITCMNCATHFIDVAHTQGLIAQGRVNGLKEAMNHIGKQKKETEKQMKAQKEFEENKEKPRPTGTHPGNPLADRKKDSENDKKAPILLKEDPKTVGELKRLNREQLIACANRHGIKIDLRKKDRHIFDLISRALFEPVN